MTQVLAGFQAEVCDLVLRMGVEVHRNAPQVTVS